MEGRFETFAASVIELSRYLQKIKDLEMRRLNLRANHTMCLYYLGRHPEGLTAAQLTRLCLEDKAAISRALAQLTQKGLITADKPEQKRSYRTAMLLTQEGREVVKKINERVESALVSGGDGLSEEQRAVFYDAMQKIASNLSNYLDQFEENIP